MNFQTANKKVHKVEDQWHYPLLIAAGFSAATKEAEGFVRKYVYEKDGRQIVCSTGVSSDYWTDNATGKGGYWSDLEPFLKGLA